MAVPYEILDAVEAQRAAEVLRRHILELVRFVYDQGWAEGNDLAIGALSHGGVCAQKVMVDDHDVGLCSALPHARHETVAVLRTLDAETRICRGRDLTPERHVLRQVAQLRAVTRVGLRQPVIDDRQQHAVA